ncbi:uncharacterized protein [Gossypium hirsutum]|uniref:Reverse transcriptase RNase H-like domain-containing protein n=1 Tax=Gossypium hirsutum TaxID=3635 RepID=A0A1U8PY50_GOSHI|nr:uncharacterized protein LOC107963138 [Gossypium hirsutum]
MVAEQNTVQNARPSNMSAQGKPPKHSGNLSGSQRETKDTAVRSEARAPARAHAIRAREEASSPDVITGCVLGQQDGSKKKEHVTYHLSKKFVEYESKYSLMEKMCCALAWTACRLRQYMLYHNIFLTRKLDPLKYIFEKPSLSGRVARWKVVLFEYDIIYVSQKAIKEAQSRNF